VLCLMPVWGVDHMAVVALHVGGRDGGEGVVYLCMRALVCTRAGTRARGVVVVCVCVCARARVCLCVCVFVRVCV
jgi:hypothetical protein